MHHTGGTLVTRDAADFAHLGIPLLDPWRPPTTADL